MLLEGVGAHCRVAAAVRKEDGAVHVGGVGSQQKGHGGGHLLGRRGPTQGHRQSADGGAQAFVASRRSYMGVRILPGATALRRTPAAPQAAARPRTAATSARFAFT